MTAPLERFAAGERFAVDPDAIERELASVWQEAGRSAERRTPVTRACLWNVVLHPDGGHLDGLARDLPRHLASRALVLGAAEAGAPELRSYISANCILAPGGGKLVCSEEIRLEATPEGRHHLPGLVRALLVPGVPVAAVFAGPVGGDPISEALLRVADRVVVFAGPEAPGCSSQREAEAPTQIDLRWHGQRELRRAVASLFEGGASANDLHRVEVAAAPERRGAAGLLVGWMADRLKASSIRTTATGFVITHASGEVQVRFHPAPHTGAMSLGFAGREVWGEVSLDGSGLALRGPDGAEKRPGAPEQRAAWLARALLHPEEDAHYAAAARFAALLTSNETAGSLLT